MRRQRTVAVLARGDEAVLDAVEQEHDHVVLVAEAPSEHSEWTAFCLRQADRLVLVGSAREPPPALFPRDRTFDMALRAGRGAEGRMRPWVDALAPTRLYPVIDAPSVAHMARRLTGTSVGIVLSGGGARAFAHVGVLAELRLAGVEIDRVGGCSMGAYVGAHFAAGRSWPEILARCRQEFVARKPLGDITLPIVAFTRGRRGLQMLHRSFGEGLIEELPREFFCTACDLAHNHTVSPAASCSPASTRSRPPGATRTWSWPSAAPTWR
ncbi:MAG TPA: patatin-like phospholipase family protein [Solirubrobacteraceae bacterium]|nr:patatin-like phospholipase family protein [Solirubrobacteraceae bacterium]